MNTRFFITKVNTTETPLFLKHSNMIDVCFMPGKAMDSGPTLDVSGMWVNIASPKDPFVIEGTNEIIKIKKDDLHNWEFI
jgi:hypothetical protein